MIATDLVAYRCANSGCSSRRTGRGQITMRGDGYPGWRGEGYCHHCHHYTMVVIDADGTAHYSVRTTNST